MKISVVIPAYNAQLTISRTLQALMEQDYPHPFEVIVVDDGSVDGTAQAIRAFSQVKYFYQTNAGPAAARNYGASKAQGEVIAFTDSDCVPHHNWISLLMKGFLSEDISAVMGGYGIANPQFPLAVCVYREIVFRHEKLLPDFPKVFGSYNFCIKKEVFERIGGFNTFYRNASGEDNDLSYKLLKAGGRIYFKRDALVDHYHPTRVGKYLKEQFRHGFWRVKMYKSHPEMVKGDGYTFWKDMLEVGWSLGMVLAVFLIFLNIISMKVFVFLIAAFIVFECSCAWVMLKNIPYKLFWGFIMFLRSFSRAFGLSTGFFAVFLEKKLNKS